MGLFAAIAGYFTYRSLQNNKMPGAGWEVLRWIQSIIIGICGIVVLMALVQFGMPKTSMCWSDNYDGLPCDQ